MFYVSWVCELYVCFYLSPFSPVPLRTSKFIAICDIYGLLRMITQIIVDNVVVRLRIRTFYCSYLLATFFTARNGTLAPSARSPFIFCGRGCSCFNCIVIIVFKIIIYIIKIEYWWCCVFSYSRIIAIPWCWNIYGCFLNLNRRRDRWREREREKWIYDFVR